jgi:hypothetical protein
MPSRDGPLVVRLGRFPIPELVYSADVVTPTAATRLSFCAGNPVKIPYPYFS